VVLNADLKHVAILNSILLRPELRNDCGLFPLFLAYDQSITFLATNFFSGSNISAFELNKRISFGQAAMRVIGTLQASTLVISLR